MTTGVTLTLEEIQATTTMIAPHVVETPVVTWRGPELDQLIGTETEVLVKLELFQRSGTFKARGALSNIMRLSNEQRERGITAMSAGNHAVAVAYAAAALGVDAKVVMQQTANPARIALAKSYGAEILMAKDGPTGFAVAEAIADKEGRSFIHPFDGKSTALGTATLALEFCQQAGKLDALIVSIGGGGLAGGVATATKLLQPDCYIVGVEPENADSMHRSFQSGQAENIGVPTTIADSLAPPMTLPIPFELCRRSIDQLMLVSEQGMRDAMGLVFRELKLAVEPAGVAATVVLGEVARKFPGGRIGVVCCGSNIDLETFHSLAAAS